MAPVRGFSGKGRAMNGQPHNPAVYRALAASDIDLRRAREARVVLANGEFVAAHCVSQGVDPARVVTLFEPVDRSLFSPDGASDGPDGSPRLVTQAGHGLETVLQTCALVARRQPGLKLLVLGKFPGELPDFAVAVEVDSDEELAKRLRWADAVLVANAGSTGLIARGFACGTPCIAPDEAAVHEIATHRWDSLLVKPAAQPMSEAILTISDAGTCARLGAPARTSSERFDAQRIAERERRVLEFEAREMLPPVSVVLPTYNRAAILEAAVRNVLEQDYPSLRLIVVNDGSTDGTAELLGRLADPRLQVIQQQNQGLPRALNAGFRQAAGEYWTWTSDDNAFRPGAIRAMVRELELQPEAGLVYANAYIRDDQGNLREFVGGPPERIAETNCVGTCFLYRAEVARRTGEYDPEFTLVEDHDFWLRLRRHAPLVWLRRFLYEYAYTADTMSRSRFLEVQSQRLALLERENAGTPGWSDRKVELLCRDASFSKQNRLPLAALRSALRALREQPGNRAGWRALLRAVMPRRLLKIARDVRGLDAG
ncbi:MAG: glycosyltransferase [Planctomycetes bacterium]|nr:glycosyltransferase [Planctomycetota bacterium]